jgi:putative transposase
MQQTTRVLHLRRKGRHARALQEQACAVNFLWNYWNELWVKVWERERPLLSGYDFEPFTNGAVKAGFGLHSGTIQAVAEEYATRRKQACKVKLRWRASRGPRRLLGWIPFRGNAIRYRNGQLFLGQMVLSLWDSDGLADYEKGRPISAMTRAVAGISTSA